LPEAVNARAGIDPRVECVTATADGRLLATAHLDGSVRVWDAATGRLVRKYAGDRGQGRKLAFSPDGLWLAAGGNDTTVSLREPLTGQEVLHRRGHTGRVFHVAFGGDGRTLLSGSGDNTALLWGLRPDGVAKDLPALWADLGGADAAAAYRAVWALADRPADCVAFLKGRLAPVAPVDEGRLRQWLADLDSDTFAVREAASRELARVADRVDGALRQALAGAVSAEAKRRLQALVDGVGAGQTAEPTQQARAVTALEWIGTPDARRLLGELAGGDPAARLTAEARASLDRLRRR
jgi:hypothetical protein